MSIIEPVIRPPAEANSFLLQVTLGCSADSCSFCGAYKSKLVPILEELDAAFPRLTRISSYANGCNVTRKNNNELAELYKHKLQYTDALKVEHHTVTNLSRTVSFMWVHCAS